MSETIAATGRNAVIDLEVRQAECTEGTNKFFSPCHSNKEAAKN